MTKQFYLFTLFLLCVIPSPAQPVANFSPSALAGCAPIVIKFTNQSSGAQSYSWIMGNGTTSTETSPSVQYINAGTFTVTLTATNAQGSHQKSIQITIYKPPTASFTADDSLGCRPHTVNFSDLSVKGTGVITKWRWDFGDGFVDSLNQTPPKHTFNIAATYTIQLQVYDDKGCNSPIKKDNYIKVGEPPTVSLSASPIHACAPPLTVNFKDASASTTGTINSWSWDFGDQTNSTSQNPSHTYNNYGTFSPKITVIDNLGCSGSYMATDYIEVVDFKGDFKIDSVNQCASLIATFTDLSTPKPSSWRWTLGSLGSASGSIIPPYSFPYSGKYDITLISADNYGCADTVSKSFTYLKVKADYSLDTNYACSVPFPVTFTNSTVGVRPLSFKWKLTEDTTITSINENVTYSYFTDRDNPIMFYPIRYYVTDAYGCMDSIISMDTIEINLPIVSPILSKTEGCIPIDVNFSYTTLSKEPIVNQFWKFGDVWTTGVNDTSTQSITFHSYDSVDVYSGKIRITNELGCMDSTIFTVSGGIEPEIKWFRLLDVDSQQVSSVCYKDTIIVIDSSGWIKQYYNEHQERYKINGFSWVFYLGVPIDSFSYNATPPHEITDLPNTKFNFDDGIIKVLPEDTILHSVGLNGCWTDTLRLIEINGPAAIPAYTDLASCSVPYSLGLSDSLSIGAGNFSGWKITFLKEGSIINNPNNETTISLPKAGEYAIEMGYNDPLGTGCLNIEIDTFRADSVVPEFIVKPLYSCLPGNRFFFKDTSRTVLGTITNWQWNFGDGDIIMNTSTTGSDLLLPADEKGGINSGTYRSPSHQYADTGVYIVNMEITTLLYRNPLQPITKNCYYSFSKAVEVHNVYPAFSMKDLAGQFNPSGCHPFTVTLLDTSAFTSKLDTIMWDYGDGSPVDTFTSSVNPLHIYRLPVINSVKTFDVKLVLIDTIGCRDSITKTAYIEVTYPHPSFSSPRFGCDSSTINFTNNSSPLSQLNYLWKFGDGDSSLLTSPSHEFNSADSFKVTLYAIDKNGCDSTTVPWDLIITDLPKINFGVDQIEVDCPPHQANFWDSTKTLLNTSDYYWTFGDSSFATQPTPSHVYYSPGIYDVKLIVRDVSIGCSDTLLQDSLIIVHGPIGKFDYEPKTGCAPLDVTYKATDTLNVASFIWDFGNGNVDTTTADEKIYTYKNGGLFFPNLSLDDGIGCRVAMQHDSIFINMPVAIFKIDSFNIKGFQSPNVKFINQSQKAVSYEWDFGEPASGSDNVSTVIHPDHTYRESGTYLVRLVALNQDGCRDTTEKPIEAFVSVTPSNAFTPDGDGKNDLFYVKGLNLNSTLFIFDRWGVKIFERPDYNNDWDGTDANGRPLTDGVYYYLLFDATTKEKIAGYVLLMRGK